MVPKPLMASMAPLKLQLTLEQNCVGFVVVNSNRDIC